MVSIKVAQRYCFLEEIEQLLDARPIPRNSILLKLTPYLDENNLLLVGG